MTLKDCCENCKSAHPKLGGNGNIYCGNFNAIVTVDELKSEVECYEATPLYRFKVEFNFDSFEIWADSIESLKRAYPYAQSINQIGE